MPSGSLVSRPFARLTSLTGLLPTVCAVCRGWDASRVCGQCLARFARSVPRCIRCALELPAGVSVCGECVRSAPDFDSGIAALSYAYPWDGLISSFKFHAALDLAPLLADLLWQAVRHGKALRPHWVLPVPLSADRLRERGYNQAWELARRIASHTGCRTDPALLLRTRSTPHQLALPRARRAANVQGAFTLEPRRRGLLRKANVALVDDVMTTGSTANELARLLKQAGAAHVQVWVVARTPKD